MNQDIVGKKAIVLVRGKIDQGYGQTIRSI